MADFVNEIKRRRTFAIISHPDAGKTTLTEKFLLYGGAIQSAGSVKGKQNDKHAVSDWMELEKQRGISITSSVLQFEYDGYCINILAQIEAQLRTLQIELERRREHYAHALRLMTHKNTFENRLMFLLSAESFNQMVRRTRYLREYSGFQQKQGEELMEKQKELDAKRAELGTTKEAKKELLAKRVEEKKELDRQEAEQRKIVDGFKKKQTEIRKRIAKQQRERDKLNEQINRLIEEEIAAQEAEMRKKNGSDTPTPTKEQKAGTPMPAYRESAADKKLSGSFQSNKGHLPVPITGPYLITSHYGINYVEGLKNVKINNHGVDIRGHMNCQARAVFDGTVSAIFEHPQIQGSYIVMIRHGQYISAYFNLSELKVKKGEKVKINEPLGLIKADMSGNYTMQFQLRRDRERLNPEQWIGF